MFSWTIDRRSPQSRSLTATAELLVSNMYVYGLSADLLQKWTITVLLTQVTAQIARKRLVNVEVTFAVELNQRYSVTFVQRYFAQWLNVFLTLVLRRPTIRNHYALFVDMYEWLKLCRCTHRRIGSFQCGVTVIGWHTCTCCCPATCPPFVKH